MSPRKMVRCRGGSQNVEGDSLMYLKIEKLADSHFMFLIDVKSTSKILEISFMHVLAFSDPPLHKC